MIARSRLEPRRSLSRLTACSCSRDRALAAGGSTSTRGTRGAGNARESSSEVAAASARVHRRRRQATIDQPPAPITQHRPAVILPINREERLELAAISQMSDELAHLAPVAGAGSSGKRLAPEPAFVLGEDLLGLHARILSEPADGRLALSASALSAVHRPWSAANAGCQTNGTRSRSAIREQQSANRCGRLLPLVRSGRTIGAGRRYRFPRSAAYSLAWREQALHLTCLAGEQPFVGRGT